MERTRLFAVFTDDGVPRLWGSATADGIAERTQECLVRYGSANLVRDYHVTGDHRLQNGVLIPPA